MSRVYGAKQRELLKLWQNNQLKRLNILEGSVRSGKTWISLVLWSFWVATMPEKKSYLMVAKTLTSLRRNCLDLLQELVGRKHFEYSLPRKEARLFGRLIYLEGVNDARAESKIRGMTLQGAYCDEVTLFTEDFFSMLLSRLSEQGAKLFGTTNPDNPNHWLKKGYIDRREKLDMLVMKFLIDDNPFLDQTYVENLKKEYAGVFYDRFILGAWVNAEGMVYPDFDREIHFVSANQVPENEMTKWFVGVDFGWEHYGVFVLIGKTQDGRYYLVREWSAQHRHIDRWIEIGLKIKEERGNINFYCDTARPDLIQSMRTAGLRALNARKDVMAGIAEVASLYKQKRLFIVKENVRRFPDEIYGYVWKEGADEPVKENDDVQDAIRYGIYSDLKYGR